MSNKTILVVGTYDTKDDELAFMEQCIRNQGGSVCSMDVSVLGEPVNPCDVSKHQVALAADSTIEAAIDTNDENQAMQIMAYTAMVKSMVSLYLVAPWVRTSRWMYARHCH